MISVADLYYYSEDVPSCLRWKINRYSGRGHGKLQVMAGTLAGKLNHDGYWMVSDGEGRRGGYLLAHRVVWELHNSTIPEGMCIDHIDGDLSNNKINNLRCISQAENTRNSRKRERNLTGVTGVSYDDTKHPRFRALVNRLDGGNWYKSFSTNKYGYDEAFRLACEWREKMILELNAQGAGYSERHGK